MCDADGIGIDVRRLGAAVSIFYLRVRALTDPRIDDQEAALEGIV